MLTYAWQEIPRFTGAELYASTRPAEHLADVFPRISSMECSSDHAPFFDDLCFKLIHQFPQFGEALAEKALGRVPSIHHRISKTIG